MSPPALETTRRSEAVPHGHPHKTYTVHPSQQSGDDYHDYGNDDDRDGDKDDDDDDGGDYETYLSKSFKHDEAQTLPMYLDYWVLPYL